MSSMILNRRAMLAGTAAAVAFGGAARAQGGGGQPARMAHLRATQGIEQIAEELLRTYPENATALGIDTGARASLKRQLTSRSPVAYGAQGRAAAERLLRLRRLSQPGVGSQVQTVIDAAVFAHERAVEGHNFGYGDVLNLNSNWAYANTPFVVNPGTGFFNGVPDFLDTNHTIATASDADAYLRRLEAFAIGLDGETDRIRIDAGHGVVMPAFLMEVALRQLRSYREQPVERWGLVTSLTRRTASLPGTDWTERATQICRERVAPALDRQIAALEASRDRTPRRTGMQGLPQGEAWYAWALRTSTTTRMTPAEVHRQGLAQNEELKAQMDALLRARGLTSSTVGARMTALGREAEQLWPNTDAGREQLLAYLNQVTADIRGRMPRAFRNMPAAPMEIRRVPPAIQDGAPNGYASAGSIDGSRPGIYYINLRDTANWPKFSLPTLTYHEGIPGHIWQGNYQNRLPLLLNLLSFNAYTEGWALYAETLGDELGVYANDPLGRLGYLQSMQFRACRLVVDTGIHSQDWSRERAIRFMVDETGRPESAMTNEVNRYFFWPGQACGYKVGHNEILRLRTATQRRLGARFDGRAFNDLVVEGGSVPLEVLARTVERWNGA